MQIVHATFESGEGGTAVEILLELGVDIEDYKLIQSQTGDLLIINLLYGHADKIIDKLKGQFDFSTNEDRSLIIFTPDTVIPRNKEKVEKSKSRASKETIVTYAKESAQLDSNFIVLAIAASIAAALGLIVNNIPVIVGSMIIAPVFGPIAAMAVGIVLGNWKLFRKGLGAEIVVVAIGIIIGYIFGAVIPDVSINPALRVRMFPTIADLLIAFAAGGAGAYSLIADVKSQPLVGVVIAAALIPVMAALGIGISMWNLSMVYGTSLLLFGNLFSLLLAIIVIFYSKGLKPQWWYESTAQEMIKKSLVFLIIAVIILTIPLSVITYRQMIKEKPTEIIRELYKEQFKDQLEARLVSINTNPNLKKTVLVLYVPAKTRKFLFDQLANRIKERLGADYRVIFEVIPTNIIQPSLSNLDK
ncbi:TIGR00341 family protein [Halobacteroides halobius DSM 5150]|uniref:TIGR00341 family protein n=1 Tax=Halobacteroides halobius (strain ATCC 35273 / DSM 5150 / MD-1) TaxID=748449 RepID=L0KCE4_HALHC|nr:TIGR00341 family protein [Halobacteroides halobius]AGB42220.1 TIGR00341 family protein [Halobacteroides halobius DSM 5150]